MENSAQRLEPWSYWPQVSYATSYKQATIPRRRQVTQLTIIGRRRHGVRLGSGEPQRRTSQDSVWFTREYLPPAKGPFG